MQKKIKLGTKVNIFICGQGFITNKLNCSRKIQGTIIATQIAWGFKYCYINLHEKLRHHTILLTKAAINSNFDSIKNIEYYYNKPCLYLFIDDNWIEIISSYENIKCRKNTI